MRNWHSNSLGVLAGLGTGLSFTLASLAAKTGYASGVSKPGGRTCRRGHQPADRGHGAFLHDRLSPVQWAGAVVVAGAILLGRARGRG